MDALSRRAASARHASNIVILLCLLLATPPAVAQTAKRYDASEQRTLLAVESVVASRAELRSIAARGDLASLAEFGAKATARAQAEPLQSEYLLAEWLSALRHLEPDAALRTQIQSLTSFPAKALVPSPEPEHGPGWVPAFDVGSLARGTLRAWQLNEQVAEALGLLASGRVDALAGTDPEALALAFSRAPVAQLEMLRSAADGMPTQALSVLAKRLREPVLYRTLLARPADEFVVAAIADVADVLPQDSAAAVLQAARGNDDLASAATLSWSRLPQNAALLIDCLGDPARGGDCAQTLAASADRSTVEALATLVKQGNDDVVTRRALIALLRTRRDDARVQLSLYAADARMPSTLRQQVNQWLR